MPVDPLAALCQAVSRGDLLIQVQWNRDRPADQTADDEKGQSQQDGTNQADRQLEPGRTFGQIEVDVVIGQQQKIDSCTDRKKRCGIEHQSADCPDGDLIEAGRSHRNKPQRAHDAQ